jgi:chromosome segregation ATPase
MQTALFRALQGISIPDDQAAEVVGQLESHVEAVVNNNIKAVLAQIAEINGKLSQLDGKISQVEGRLDGKIAQLEGRLEGKIAQLEGKLEGKIAHIEGRVIAVEGKLTAVQMTLDSMRGQIQLMTVMLGVIGLAIAAGPIVSRFVR